MKGETKVKIGVAVLIALLLAGFVAVNMKVIEVNLLVARVEMRRSVMILGIFFAGFIVGWTVRAVFGAINKGRKAAAGDEG